jgi:hypothetical protein
MNKKQLLVGLGFVAVGTLAALLYWRLKPGSAISPAGKEDQKTTVAEKFDFVWQEWQDPAGFAFKYPEGVKIDNHPDDKANYANLTLSSPDKKGQIDILVNDSNYSDLSEWLANDELVKGGRGLDTQIASASAKKIALNNGRIVSALIDPDQVIYTIIGRMENEEYWRQVYEKILDSFRLIPLEGESEAQFSNWLEGFETTGVDIVEPVEVIE